MKSKITKSALFAIPLLAVTVLAGSAAYAATETTSSAGTAGTATNRALHAKLTDAQKETMKQVRELYHQGKTAEAEALAKQAGLPERPAHKMGQGMGHREHGKKFDSKFKNLTSEQKAALEAKRTAVENAITANDYTTFSSLIAGTPFEGKVTQDNFAKIVQAQVLHKSGDHEAARKLMEEIGIKGPGPRPGSNAAQAK